jgi:hypothetical protein
MTIDDPIEEQAVRTLTAAARSEHDFAGWLANVLARVAANLGSTDALTAGRPGSWEAALVTAWSRARPAAT